MSKTFLKTSRFVSPPPKQALHSSNKFGISEQCANIKSPRRFERFQNKFLDISNTQNSSYKASRFASFFYKNGFVFIDQIWHFEIFYQYSITQKTCSRFTDRLQNELKFQCFPCFHGKRGFVFVYQTWYFRPLYQKSNSNIQKKIGSPPFPKTMF